MDSDGGYHKFDFVKCYFKSLPQINNPLQKVKFAYFYKNNLL